MHVLIIGGGGREHALAWKVAQSPRVARVYVAPGNPGTAAEAKTSNVAIEGDDIAALVAFATEQHIDLTIVGPEAPLVAGVVDAFTAAGLRCFGPSQAAAQLEGSKAFCKAFMQRHAIPTAHYQVFTELEPALECIAQTRLPVVVKADGLAAGKGVIIAHTREHAEKTVRAMLTADAFGEAGHQVVIEDFLSGEELSFIVLVDGQNILPLATSQDHKARDDGDQGPNTGGMGAYSPASLDTPTLQARILTEVIEPTVRGMAAEGMPYRGFLYAGLMIDAAGTPQVLEFNCRCGDPETQPIMLRLQSDLVDLIDAAIDGRLDQVNAVWDPRPALGVVMAAGGYPGGYRRGDIIAGLSVDEPHSHALKVFHAGTRQHGEHIVTHGGRVLCVTALGNTLTAAQQQAYAQVRHISWQDAYYRTDIGHRAIARERMDTE